MKLAPCQKCREERARRTEALGLMVDAQNRILELELLLGAVRAIMLDQDDRDELTDDERAVLERVKRAIGEPEKVDAAMRAVLAGKVAS